MRINLKVIALASCAVVAVSAPRPAGAVIPVTCDNCSTFIQQLLQYAKEVQGVATEIQQLQTQISMYTNMVTNTVRLPQQLWGQVQGDIMRVQALSNIGSILAGNSGSMIGRLNSAQGYLGQVESLGSMPGQLIAWQTTIGNDLDSMGRVLGMQEAHANNRTALLATLQQHSLSAVGQMQALNAANELANNNANTLHEVHETLIAMAKQQTEEFAVNYDRQASEDAVLFNYVNTQPVAVAGFHGW